MNLQVIYPSQLSIVEWNVMTIMRQGLIDFQSVV